jgi:poly(hydroxyalkanoate) depolymerase family esterase
LRFGISKTLARALREQRKVVKLLEAALRPPRRTRSRKVPPGLETTAAFNTNPGRLVMKTFAPAKLPKKPPLVVVLHGCGQSPESLDAAAGFSKLAKERGFVLVYPEQTRSNNSQRCFNWFRPSAVARDRGEVLSIKQMVEHACKRYRVDRQRIYLVGLSAGGAMTAALVANFPELFAGAAIMAGMPVGAARDVMSAVRAMKSGAPTPAAGWGSRIADISPARRSWPPISIWHGTADRVVNPTNAAASVDQWLEATGLDRGSGRIQKRPWGELHSWKGADGAELAFYSIAGLGHGLPVKVRGDLRSKDPFVLPADISAPAELMRAWGLSRL